jgi:hypothetical protein
LGGGRATQAEIAIDHVDIGLMPTEFASALAKRVLQPQALLVAHHLRIPTMPSRHSDREASTCSNLMASTVLRRWRPGGQFRQV